MKKQKYAFSLVELIVVITVLAILATIAFVSFQGFSKDARDSVRLSDIKSISRTLDLYYIAKEKYPMPTNYENITYSGAIVWKQGYFGNTTLAETRTLSNIPEDPKTGTSYYYSITNDGQEYQIGGATENEIQTSFISQVNANIDYKAYIKGSYNGIIVKTNTGGEDYILASPSILAIDTSITDFQELINQKKLIYNNFYNLPIEYGNDENFITGFDFIPNKTLVFKGNIEDLKDQGNQILLLKNISEAYSGTILSDINNNFKNITSVTIDLNNPSSQLISLACNIVNYNLKYKTTCSGLNFISFYVINVLNIDISNIPGNLNTAFQDSDGNFWFGSNEGLTLYDGENWITYVNDSQDPNSLINNNVTSIAKDNNGYYWVGTVNGVSKFDGIDTWVNYDSDVLVSTHIQYIYTSSDGTVRIGTNGGANSFDGSDWESYEKAKNKTGGILSANNVTTILKDSNNIIWFGVQSAGVDKYDKANDTVTNYDDTNGLINKQVNYIFEDSNNIIWFGTDGGISKVTGDSDNINNWVGFSESDGLVDNRITYIFEDSNNIIWFGTQNGLSKFDGVNWTNYTTAGGLIGSQVHLIYEDDNGNILVLTEGGLTTIGTDGNIIP